MVGSTAPLFALEAAFADPAVDLAVLVDIGIVITSRVETDFYLNAFGQDADRLRDTLYSRQRALHPADFAAAVLTAIAMPPHADISRIEIMPTDQAAGGHIYPDRRPD